MNNITIETNENEYILTTIIEGVKYSQRYERKDTSNPTFVVDIKTAQKRFLEYVIFMEVYNV